MNQNTAPAATALTVGARVQYDGNRFGTVAQVGAAVEGFDQPVQVRTSYGRLFWSEAATLTPAPAVSAVGAQHFSPWGTSESFICGANAVGRRNSGRDLDRSLTTCPACLEQLAAYGI